MAGSRSSFLRVGRRSCRLRSPKNSIAAELIRQIETLCLSLKNFCRESDKFLVKDILFPQYGIIIDSVAFKLKIIKASLI